MSEPPSKFQRRAFRQQITGMGVCALLSPRSLVVQWFVSMTPYMSIKYCKTGTIVKLSRSNIGAQVHL